MPGETDQWSRGVDYESFMGRWSRRVAREFVAWVGAGPERRWLDVGSGTGALTGVIAATAQPAGIVGVDAAPAYVADARRRVPGRHIRFEIGDAHGLECQGAFDAAVSGLMLNFAADAGAVVAAMRRAVTSGGIAAAYVWDYAGRMDLLRPFWDAAVALDPGARHLDEAVRFAAWDADHLATLWRGAGLREVRTTGFDVALDVRDFDDYWRPLLGGQGPAASHLAALDERRRAALGDLVRARLPVAADGSLQLRATAWAVAGVTP